MNVNEKRPAEAGRVNETPETVPRLRDRYRVVGEAARAAIDRILDTRPSRTRLAVLAVVVRELVTFSRLEDQLALAWIARRAGCSVDSARRALKAFADLGVIRYVPGDTPRGGDRQASRVALVVPLADSSNRSPGTDLQPVPPAESALTPSKARGIPLADRRHPSEKYREDTEARARAIANARTLGENWAGVRDVNDAALESALRDIPDATDETVAAGFEARDRKEAQLRAKGPRAGVR